MIQYHKRNVTSRHSFATLLLLLIIAASCDDKQEVPTPLITNFSPTSGISGTEIIVQGKNFQSKPSDNLVTIGNVTAFVSAATPETLHIVVPEGAVTGRIVISNNSGKSATSTTDFIVYDKVSLITFSPQTAEAGSTINISGSGFSTTLTNNAVTIGGVSATVIAATPTGLTVTVPISGITGLIELKVNGQTVTTTDPFVYIPKIAQLLPAIAAVGGSIIISGSGFTPDLEKNKVFFQGLQGLVMEATPNTIQVRIPVGAVTGPVNIETDGHQLNGPVCKIVIEATSAGGPGYDVGRSIAVDQSGNFYIAGTFSKTASFGNQSVTSPDTDIFIAKYSAVGKIIWVKRAGGISNSENVGAVEVDGAGNVYVVGTCSPDAVFGSITLTGNVGGFIAKLNPGGDFIWARKFTSNSSQATSVSDVTFDPASNPILVGSFAGKLTIGTKTIEAPGGGPTPPTNPFLVKLNKTDGSALLVKHFETGSSSSSAFSIDHLANNDLVIGGSFFNSAIFGATTFTSPSATDLDAFMMRVDKTGELIWVKQFGGTGWGNIYDVKVDPSDDILVTGYFGSALNGPGIALTAFGNENFFLTKIASSGTAKWSSAGSSNYANGNSVAVDATGNIYAAGYFTNDITFNNQTTSTDTNSRQMMVVKYDTNGNLQWVKQAGGEESDNAYDVTIDSDGLALVTGYIRQEGTQLGQTAVTNAGNDDVFWWRVWP